MTLADGRRIVRGVSGDRGTTPEYPDPRRQDMSRAGGAAPLPDISQHDMDRIAGERSREDEALRGHKKPSFWKRLKAWFARPAPKRDSYVSNVVDPDDRRFIPRR